MKRDKSLEEAAAKILAGEYVLNESISSNDIIQSQSALGGEQPTNLKQLKDES